MALVYILDRFATDVIAILSNESPKACPFWDDLHTEQLESALLSYEFSTSAGHSDSDKIVAENHVIIQDRDGSHVLFQIKRVEDEIQNGAHIKRVYSENVAVGDLFGAVLRPNTQNGVAADDVLAYVLQGTGWSVGLTEWDGIQSFDWQSYPTVLAAVQEIGTKFSGDLRFRVEFNNGEVGRKFIDLRPRGSETGVRFEYRVNMNGVKRTEDSTDLVTALVGVGKADDKGVRMTFKDLTASDKPVGQDFIEDEAALQRWGKADGRHIMGVYDDSDADSPTALLERTRAELAKRSRPRMTYELDAILLETLTGYDHMKVQLGDTVTVKDMGFNPYLAISARVIELVRSYADPRQDKVTLGEFKPLSVDTNALIRKLEDTILRHAGVWEAVGTGTGEMMYKSATEPTTPTVDMLWLDTSKPLNVLKRWDGSTWLRATPTVASDVGAEPIIIKSSTEPAMVANLMWLNIASVPNILYRCNGSAWRKLTPTEAAEVNAETPAGAQTKADAAKQAAIDAANAETSAAETRAQVYADGKVTTEEQARLDQAAANLATAQAHADTQASAAQQAAIDAAAADAKSKADAAQAAAIAEAQAKADLAETNAKAHADGIVSTEEQARIDQAAANLSAAQSDAQTKASAAQTAATTAAQKYTDDNTGNLVNNPTRSGTLDKWTSYGYTNWSIDATQTLGGVAVNSHKLAATGDAESYSSKFTIDPSKGYEVTAWLKQDVQAGTTYFGLYIYNAAGSLLPVTEVNIADGATASTSYPAFFGGQVLPLGSFKKFVGFVFPHGTDPAALKGLGVNATKAYILPANAALMRVRYLNYENAGTARTLWAAQINAQELGATQQTLTAGATVLNFNKRNDRKSAVPANPSIIKDGTAVDHTINSDGSANLSFEWTYTGSGDSYDVDGFFVFVRSSTTNDIWYFDSSTDKSQEHVYAVGSDKRAAYLYGVPANGFYTFGVQAYRYVDNDIAAAGVLKSAIMQPTAAGEFPYQPSTTVAFAGNVTGTVNGVAANLVETTSGAQAKADAAKNAATSAAASDATTKANAAEKNAKDAVANGSVNLPTSKLTGAIEVATNKLQQGANMYWDAGGLVLIDPANGNNRVRITSSGIGVSTDAGSTYGNALTSAGLVAEKITGNKISGVTLETSQSINVGTTVNIGYGAATNAERKITFDSNPGISLAGGTGPYGVGLTLAGQSLQVDTGDIMFYNKLQIIKNSQVNAVLSGSNTFAAGAWTKVKYVTEYSDQYGEYDTVNCRFIPNPGGTYLAIANLSLPMPATGSNTVAMAIYKNGVEYARVFQASNLTNNVQASGSTIAFQVATNDYLEAFVYTSAAVTVPANATFNHFKLWRLG